MLLKNTMSLMHVLLAMGWVLGLAFRASAGSPAAQTLAVWVDSETGGADLASALQALLEVEAVQQWPGRIIERADLNRLLEEMKLPRSGFGDPDRQLELGRLIHADCLLTARVTPASVAVAMKMFPSTAIIYEREYRERLQADRLAVDIVTNAVRAFQEWHRDPNAPQVSIGSFYYADPHRRFLGFSRTIGEQLRAELVGAADITLAERLLPSQLLSEFELARAGLTKPLARCLSAPASDILLYGEFQPRTEQVLDSNAVMLDGTLILLSPTGLCERRTAEFSCRSDQPEIVTREAVSIIRQAATEIRGKLTAGTQRSFSQQEFEEFKKQAFRLMPSPPMEDGDFYKQGYYRGSSQFAPVEDLDRALHMLECAMLFRGDDTQVLVCMAAVLKGMAWSISQNPGQRVGSLLDGRAPVRRLDSDSSEVVNWLSETALDLVERAYYLDSNWNTRGMYRGLCAADSGSSEGRSSRALKAAQHIWDTRHEEAWYPGDVRFAFSKLFECQTDLQRQYGMFVQAVREYETAKDGMRDIFVLFQVFAGRVERCSGDCPEIRQMQPVAAQLLGEESLLLRSLGHILYVVIYRKMDELDKEAGVPPEFAIHFRASLEALSDLHQRYGEEFADSSYSYRLGASFDIYEKVVRKHGLKDDIVELKERYLALQMGAGDYNSLGTMTLFRAILPSLWEAHRYERARELVTELLNHNAAGGRGDYDRMWLARQHHLLLLAMREEAAVGTEALERIEFDDGATDSVTKLVTCGTGIAGIRGERWQGCAFRLGPSARQAEVLKDLTCNVYDLACTDKFIGIGTDLNGFYLVDIRSSEVRRLDPENSGLPARRVTLVCDCEDSFFIGVPDTDNAYTHIYRLEPNTSRITNTDTQLCPEYYWRMKAATLAAKQSPVIAQTWQHRTAQAGDKTLQFSCTDRREVMRDVSVEIVGGNQLVKYRGFELSYVFDFVQWQGMLLFATGNALYVSEPGSNEIRCILCGPDLLFLSLCPLGDRMYIGTSEGLYRLGADRFRELVVKSE